MCTLLRKGKWYAYKIWVSNWYQMYRLLNVGHSLPIGVHTGFAVSGQNQATCIWYQFGIEILYLYHYSPLWKIPCVHHRTLPVSFCGFIYLFFLMWILIADMSSTAFIEPLPITEFVCQLLNRDVYIFSICWPSLISICFPLVNLFAFSILARLSFFDELTY